MQITTFSVKAETLSGNIKTLRRNFATREDAEDHPVRLSLWKRVWVEPVIKPVAEKKAPAIPPLPWGWVGPDSEDPRGLHNLYLVDANGKKIAALWAGTGAWLMAEFIVDLVNKTTQNPSPSAEEAPRER